MVLIGLSPVLGHRDRCVSTDGREVEAHIVRPGVREISQAIGCAERSLSPMPVWPEWARWRPSAGWSLPLRLISGSRVDLSVPANGGSREGGEPPARV